MNTKTMMAMTAGVLLALVAAVAIAGERNLFYDRDRMYLWTDPDTGCQYLTRNSYGNSPVPRIANDGKSHMGCAQIRRAPEA